MNEIKHTLMASVSCFANGVDHFFPSSRLTAVADKLRELGVMNFEAYVTGLQDAHLSPV